MRAYTSALPFVFKAGYFIKLRDNYLLFNFIGYVY
jgi:hypothetical protein